MQKDESEGEQGWHHRQLQQLPASCAPREEEGGELVPGGHRGGDPAEGAIPEGADRGAVGYEHQLQHSPGAQERRGRGC